MIRTRSRSNRGAAPVGMLAAILPLLIAGCDSTHNPPDSAMDAPTPAEPAIAPTGPDQAAPPPPPTTLDAALPAESPIAEVDMKPTEGNTAAGQLSLLVEAGGIRISGTLQGASPAGEHGFHVHESGDCSAPDASSAGGHFSAAGMSHGDPASDSHHTGDMPNQTADAQGRIDVNVLLEGVEYGTGSATDIANRALVLHQKADDYTSQPAGDSGPRIACGVIPARTAPASAAEPAATPDAGSAEDIPATPPAG